MRQIKGIVLTRTTISNASNLHLLDLEKVFLSSTTKEQIFSSCTNLEQLSVGEEITENDISLITRYCKRLRFLAIVNNTNIGNDSMIKLMKNCNYIKHLDVGGCSKLGDDFLTCLMNHGITLEYLGLDWLQSISKMKLAEFIKACPNLKYLEMNQHQQANLDVAKVVLSNNHALLVKKTNPLAHTLD